MQNILENLKEFWQFTGFANFEFGYLIMIIVGCLFIFLAIKFEWEPMLLVPIGFGILIGNIPLFAGLNVGVYEEGSVLNILYQGVQRGFYPPLIFLGIGAMTDFSALIANPKLLLIGAAAQFHHGGRHAAGKHLLGNDARRHQRKRQSAGEMATAARVLKSAELDIGHPIGMPGPRNLPEQVIIAAAGILIAEQDRERGSGRMAFIHPAEELRHVRFDARRRSGRTGAAARQISFEISGIERQSGLDAVNDDTYGRTVGLSEKGEGEFISKSVHIAP